MKDKKTKIGMTHFDAKLRGNERRMQWGHVPVRLLRSGKYREYFEKRWKPSTDCRKLMELPSSFFGWVALLVSRYYADFLRGLAVTMEIATISTILGVCIGFLVGVLRSVPEDKGTPVLYRVFLKILKAIMAAYVEIIRGTPLMVQAMVLYYGTMSMWGLDIPSFRAGVIVLSVHIGAYMSESVRGAIGAIDRGQMEGGMAVGMSYAQIMFHVIIPQAFRNLIPQIGNTYVSSIKDTSVLNVIAVTEMYFAARTITGTYYKFFETYIIVCVIYFVVTFSVSRILKVVEKLLAGKSNYELIAEEEL